MTLIEVVSMLRATGYPVAFSHFSSEPPSIPFITYLTPSTENFKADNKVYTKITNVDIELYTEKKDLAAEKKIEDLLNENELPWDVYEVYIESERLFQRTYEIGVI